MHMVDMGTAFSETKLVQDRKGHTIPDCIYSEWVYRHGPTRTISADDEFNKRSITDKLKLRGIECAARPSRRHKNIRKVERNNGTLKSILEHLENAAESSGKKNDPEY